MKVYNTLSGKKEKFSPIHDGKVGMYVCGPTVYDFGHLGHGRSAVSFDVIRKYLVYKGFDVNFISNYTDIDDKMIARAEIMKISVSELAEKIIPEYRQDYAALGVLSGDEEPLATEHVYEMIEMIAGLEKKGHTYVISDGVYFDVKTFADYGKLSGQKMDELRAGVRKDINPEKRNHQDFVLWKLSKPGEPSWDSPWGKGRPGWHIECSSMSRKYLGETFDIHGGGADLTFPHHECEIAQSEALSGRRFAKYWLHNGFIRIDNEKMSKSLGNFFTLRDIFKEYDPQVIRYMFLQTHYRSPIDFTNKLLEQSANSLMRVHDFFRRLSDYEGDGKDDMSEGIASIRKRFEEAMNDDFETPVALAVCFDLIRIVNKKIDHGKLSTVGKEAILHLIEKFDSVLGIFKPTTLVKIGDDIEKLISERDKARANKDWVRADEIRDVLLERGIALEDSSGGTIWKKV
ncbi:cysteine--tRNA ligase [Patescibacteria group bacterium]|nr:cysteine--tRNA ligase [Patescibacteria group bacterium]MBU1702913.1 cysteine--tRNA ligase [Patescibacteria group bacterium]MBU1954412.1 cysteine--tRNA ligase [Patescibacteria group bacterium]